MKNITKNSKIFFRADANAHLGFGHVMRLLALSEIIKDHFTCSFIIHNPSQTLEQQIYLSCHEIFNIPAFESLESEVHYLKEEILDPDAFMVLDGYHFTESYQRSIRSAGITLICLDDLHQLHFYVDAVINPAGGINIQHYQGEIYTWYKLGPAFAPLRTPFRKAAQQHRQHIEKIEDIFICFGGSDYHNLTVKTVKASLSVICFKKIQVVVGSAYKHMASLQEVSQAHPEKIIIHQNLAAEDMVQLMQMCHLAVAPASTIAYEIAMVGLGLLTGLSADNQNGIARFLSEAQCATFIGDFRNQSEEMLQQHIETYTLATLHQQILHQSAVFFDNTALLLKLFQGLALERQIHIRKADINDLLTYFHWTNEARTRKQAIHSEAIDIKTHTDWFRKKISSQTDFLFIFELNQQPVGQVRFDMAEDTYIISFSVDVKFRGQGMGNILIKKALEALQKQLNFRPKVKAYVKPANTASLNVFFQNSFLSKGREKINNMMLEVFEK